MKKNIGTTDKAGRVLAALVIAVLYFTGLISGPLAIGLGVVALIFVVTSTISFCPLYLPFGISTIKKKENEK